MQKPVTHTQRLAAGRKRRNSGQTWRNCAPPPLPPAHRLHRVYRFHPTPSRQTGLLESATSVTPTRKNPREKQTHLKVTLQCLDLIQTMMVRPPLPQTKQDANADQPSGPVVSQSDTLAEKNAQKRPAVRRAGWCVALGKTSAIRAMTDAAQATNALFSRP